MWKSVKRILVLLLMIFTFAGTTSCGMINQKIHITMYLWDKSMCKELTPWLEEEFPNVKFDFIAGYNKIDFYESLEKRNALPDIMTCRRFSLNDASKISDSLLDMSETELVGTFYTTYIENNRDKNGAIQWLPMCAEVDGIIANKDVFEENNIPLPTNYKEFADACRFFEENGIGGFYNDYFYDYSCLEAMQGCAASELMSRKGTDWRTEYESEKAGEQVGLDYEVWSTVFKKFEQFLKDTYTDSDDIKRTFYEAKDLLIKNKCAMIRGTGNDCVNMNNEYGTNCVMLPYYGESAEDNWVLTYPMYQVAVNKNVKNNDEKYKVVMQVMEKIFSEEGQKRSASEAAFLTYNSIAELEVPECFGPIRECIEKNHLYQRLASTEIFSISLDVTKKMINKEYDAEGAYNDFNAQLTSEEKSTEHEIIFSQDKEYSYFADENGSEAASSVANSLKNYFKSDILIGYSTFMTSSVFAGDYTLQEIKWLVHERALVKQAELTGEQVIEVMEWLVNVKEDGSNPVLHRNMLPVTSGIEYSVTDNGDGTFKLIDVTINRKKIDTTQKYNVIMLGDDIAIESEVYGNSPKPQEIQSLLNADMFDKNYMTNLILEIDKFAEPSEYITINTH